MGLGKNYILRSILVFAFLTTTALRAASILSYLDFDTMNKEIVQQHQTLEGTYNYGQKWEGTLCSDCYYRYGFDFKGELQDVRTEVQSEEQVQVYADLRNIGVWANGAYSSDYSLCSPIWAKVWLGVDRAEAWVRVNFEMGDLTKMKLVVERTQFGKIELGEWVPDWFERLLTKLANDTMSRVWSSKLGAYLSEKITEVVRTKMPAPVQ